MEGVRGGGYLPCFGKGAIGKCVSIAHAIQVRTRDLEIRLGDRPCIAYGSGRGGNQETILYRSGHDDLRGGD